MTGEPTTYSVSAAFQARIACTILAMQPATLFIPTDVTVQNLSHELRHRSCKFSAHAMKRRPATNSCHPNQAVLSTHLRAHER